MKKIIIASLATALIAVSLPAAAATSHTRKAATASSEQVRNANAMLSTGGYELPRGNASAAPAGH